MIVVVAALALVVAAVVAGITAARATARRCRRRADDASGAPPLSLDLGVRVDPEAVDLREALRLYAAGKRAEAEKLFARHDSLEARIGESFSTGRTAPLPADAAVGAAPEERGRAAQPRDRPVLGRRAGAEDAWKSAASLEPDTAYAVTAGNLLHPDFARNLPDLRPSTEVPADIRKLSAPAQLALLERRARDGRRSPIGSSTASRCSGSASSARPSASTRRPPDGAPNDPEARVAAAVGLFDKARPAQAFSRLGPLSREFPKAATVRFHLGLLLLWSGR